MMIKGIAALKYTANKSSFGDSKIEIIHTRANTSKVKNVIKAETRSLLNMLSNCFIIIIKCNS